MSPLTESFDRALREREIGLERIAETEGLRAARRETYEHARMLHDAYKRAAELLARWAKIENTQPRRR